MPALERRFIESAEIRATGRKLTGSALRYGDVSPTHRERFAPGSVTVAPSAWLNYRHDPERALCWRGAGLEIQASESGIELNAELPATPLADRVLTEVRAGTLTGLSIEFQCLADRMETGIRVVTEAILEGIAVCSNPSYPNTSIEARQKGHRETLWGMLL